MKKVISVLSLLLFSLTLLAQAVKEVAPPYNIKTISFVQNDQNIVPIFKLGEGFQLQFDDLFGSEANYYYEIIHCDYNWNPTTIAKNEYLEGFDNQRIQNYKNSFNTLQIYSHYNLSIPNQFTKYLKISGNYKILILDENKEIVFTRMFVLYEDLVSVPIQVKRSRNISTIEMKQNLDFAIRSNKIQFQNPLRNVKVLILQNDQFSTALKNVIPQYTIGNELIYKYDTETQFWAGNEYLYFENKDIRSATNNVARIDSSTPIYGAYLYTSEARRNYPYSFTQDINGNFVVQNYNSMESEIEADYTWVYFTLSAPTFIQNKDIYVTGMFNNYTLLPEYKMDYNAKKAVYEKSMLIKQGFTNFQYIIANETANIDHENAIDGNFYQTENKYTILVYYKDGIDRYDRIVGKGSANSVNIVN
ncbi:hypothetical protein RCH18_003037 [Flavobacterium sp. PL11]|jgi:hypothetical protein|uniref:type IX secretion system plug protein n=1 Tax=Flavobacterium sp. PL11 TaxID=3071717 RepID=UPI002DFF2E30|nr:hypothetical protein [Flavobacterium sp. PL11]